MIQTPKEKAACKLDTCETAQKTEHTEFTHAFHQSGPADGPGPVSYLTERWGLVRHLPTLADVDRFLIEIGGRP